MNRVELSKINCLLSFWEAILSAKIGTKVYLHYSTVKGRATEKEIEDNVSEIFVTTGQILNIPLEKLFDSDTNREEVEASQIATKLVRDKYPKKIFSDKKLAIYINRERSTCIHRIDTANELYKYNKPFRDKFDRVKEACAERGLL